MQIHLSPWERRQRNSIDSVLCINRHSNTATGRLLSCSWCLYSIFSGYLLVINIDERLWWIRFDLFIIFYFWNASGDVWMLWMRRPTTVWIVPIFKWCSFHTFASFFIFYKARWVYRKFVFWASSIKNNFLSNSGRNVRVRSGYFGHLRAQFAVCVEIN